MIPLKITFRFAAPYVVDSEYPKHLDGVLAWLRVQEAERQGLPDAWSHGDELPLAKAGGGDDWVWQASRIFFVPATPREIVNMQRKSDPGQFYEDFDRGLWSNDKTPKQGTDRKRPPTINTQSGQFRAYQYYVSTQWMERAEAWCIGDPAEVSRLLANLDHLGKMGRNGYGRLAGVTVEPTAPEDAEKWRLRYLPQDVPGLANVDYAPVGAPARAPYWDKLRRFPMLDPVV